MKDNGYKNSGKRLAGLLAMSGRLLLRRVYDQLR
jgi:hypothetical protein